MSRFYNWRAPCSIVLSLLKMILIFYLEYTHADIIYHLCEAYILSFTIDSILPVQHCVKCQVFHISRATKCFIYLTQATVVLYSTHDFAKYFHATLCYIDLTQDLDLVYYSLYSTHSLCVCFRAIKCFIYLAQFVFCQFRVQHCVKF